jgi:hypothetical protein
MKLFSIAIALAATTACWTDKTSPNMPPPVANTAPMAAPPEAAPPPPADPLAMLPIECRDYGAAIHKLASCDKMPQAARDAMSQAFAQFTASWPELSPEAKLQVESACKAGLDAVTDSAKIICAP